jgi:hypothetical protein
VLVTVLAVLVWRDLGELVVYGLLLMRVSNALGQLFEENLESSKKIVKS